MLSQIPGEMLAGLVLWLMVKWGWLSAGWAVGLLVLWVAKDYAGYLLVRGSLGPSRVGADGLVGARGVVRVALAPHGQVQVAGELWRARAVTPGERIEAGRPVRVQAVHGLTLLVEVGPSPDPEPHAAEPS
jgi:membrane protein implicated in regulation of membrane protease activity